MKAEYWQKGEALDYANKSEDVIEAGTVIAVGAGRIGVAGMDIPPGETGSIHMVGVFIVKKAAVEVHMGDMLYYNESDQVIGTDDTNIPAGYAAADAAAGDESVYVKLLG